MAAGSRPLRRCTAALAFLVVLGPAAALAQRADQATIDALLAAVERSGCQMERNGELHDAKKGAEHLRTKLERAGKRVQTVEQFIEHVATGSSMSGQPYRVLCPGKAPVESRDWMRARLASLRASSPPAGAGKP
jgi:hypothetical protein